MPFSKPKHATVEFVSSRRILVHVWTYEEKSRPLHPCLRKSLSLKPQL